MSRHLGEISVAEGFIIGYFKNVSSYLQDKYVKN